MKCWNVLEKLQRSLLALSTDRLGATAPSCYRNSDSSLCPIRGRLHSLRLEGSNVPSQYDARIRRANAGMVELDRRDLARLVFKPGRNLAAEDRYHGDERDRHESNEEPILGDRDGILFPNEPANLVHFRITHD